MQSLILLQAPCRSRLTLVLSLDRLLLRPRNPVAPPPGAGATRAEASGYERLDAREEIDREREETRENEKDSASDSIRYKQPEVKQRRRPDFCGAEEMPGEHCTSLGYLIAAIYW